MSTKHFVMTAVITISLLILTLATMAPQAYAQAIAGDPCFLTAKSSTPITIDTGNFQQVIAGVTNKQIYICNLVFTGSAASGFNISFAGISSGCSSGLTLLGILWPANNLPVTAGGGNSTLFSLPPGNNFCVELGGVSPLQARGWVTYVQK